MSKQYESPGVGYEEDEISGVREKAFTPVVGIVGGATKGPTTLTEVTMQKKLINIFGNPTDNDLGVFSAGYIVEDKCLVLYKRVMGDGASQGSAGDDTTDKFTFVSRWYDSTLEGATIELKFDKDAESVDYELKQGKTVIESYTNLSYNKEDKKYLPKFLESVGSRIIATDTDVEEFSDVVLTLRGINDGIESLTPQDYIDAAGEFSNADILEVNMIITPGVVDTEVQNAYIKLVKQRGDCEYIPDIPFGTTPQSALEFVNNPEDGSAGLDEQMASVFGPWVKVTDTIRKKNVWAPPSAIAARVTVQSDNIKQGCWFAAAGLSDERGVVPRAVELEYTLTKEERDSWYGGTNVINPIVYFKGHGIAIFGNKTTKRTEQYAEESVYCQRHIRRMANYIRRILIDISLTCIFDPNDSTTWDDWTGQIIPKLEEIKHTRGLSAYKVVMDETTVSDDDIKDGQAPGIVYIKPIRALEYIPIKFVATEDSVIFVDKEEEGESSIMSAEGGLVDGF